MLQSISPSGGTETSAEAFSRRRFIILSVRKPRRRNGKIQASASAIGIQLRDGVECVSCGIMILRPAFLADRGQRLQAIISALGATTAAPAGECLNCVCRNCDSAGSSRCDPVKCSRQ
jgi:hypothetical protein